MSACRRLQSVHMSGRLFISFLLSISSVVGCFRGLQSIGPSGMGSMVTEISIADTHDCTM